MFFLNFYVDPSLFCVSLMQIRVAPNLLMLFTSLLRALSPFTLTI